MNTGSYGYSKRVKSDNEILSQMIVDRDREIGSHQDRIRELAKQRLNDLDKLRAQYIEYLNLAIQYRTEKKNISANYWQGRADGIYLAVEMLSA